MSSRALLLPLLACACMAEPRPHPPPRVLSGPEAVAIATRYTRSRGVVVDYTNEARLDDRARWHVDLGGARGRDRALVTVDGVTGRVLTARLWASLLELEPLPPPRPGTAPPPTSPDPTVPPPPPP